MLNPGLSAEHSTESNIRGWTDGNREPDLTLDITSRWIFVDFPGAWVMFKLKMCFLQIGMSQKWLLHPVVFAETKTRVLAVLQGQFGISHRGKYKK